MPYTIRGASIDDADTLAEYNIKMAMETEDLALDPDRIGKGVRALLLDKSKGSYFVAVVGAAPDVLSLGSGSI